MLYKILDILKSPYLMFWIAGIILTLNFLRRNNNFFDIKAIFSEQFIMFKDCKGQLLIFYIVPLLLSIGTVRIKCIDKEMLNNINIILSIFLSMLFAMLSILHGYNGEKNSNYIKVLKETNNTIMFECVLCIILLILSFIELFIDDYNYSISLLIMSSIIYYLMFTVILHIFIIIKRLKNLFEHK